MKWQKTYNVFKIKKIETQYFEIKWNKRLSQFKTMKHIYRFHILRSTYWQRILICNCVLDKSYCLTLQPAITLWLSPLQYSCLENPWTEELGRLQSMASLGVGHYWATSLSLFTFMHWRRKWKPTPVFLPGESQGWGSPVGCSLWGRTESDPTEAT